MPRLAVLGPPGSRLPYGTYADNRGIGSHRGMGVEAQRQALDGVCRICRREVLCSALAPSRCKFSNGTAEKRTGSIGMQPHLQFRRDFASSVLRSANRVAHVARTLRDSSVDQVHPGRNRLCTGEANGQRHAHGAGRSASTSGRQDSRHVSRRQSQRRLAQASSGRPRLAPLGWRCEARRRLSRSGSAADRKRTEFCLHGCIHRIARRA